MADIADAGAVARCFAGAQAAYVMIPPKIGRQDILAHDRRVADALASAIEKGASITSSPLAALVLTRRTALTYLDEKLGGIAGLNLICLRAGYLMENTLAQIGLIQAMGKAAGPLRGDLKLPMIATRDVGAFAAEALLKRSFGGKQTCKLLRQRDLDMNEATTVIGKAIGKTDLTYMQLPPEHVRPGILQIRMSANMADLLLEMSAALNSGFMKVRWKIGQSRTRPPQRLRRLSQTPSCQSIKASFRPLKASFLHR